MDGSRRRWGGGRWPALSLYLGLAAIFLAGCLLEPAFIRLENQRDILQRVAINGILAVGMTLVILTGGIDLSVGSMLSLGSVLAAMLMMGRGPNRAVGLVLAAAAYALVRGGLALAARAGAGRPRRRWGAVAAGVLAAGAVLLWGRHQAAAGFGVAAALVLVPLTGAAFGSVSGEIIGRGRLQPFIVTLALMIALLGLAKFIAGRGGQIHAVYVLSAEERGDPAGLQMLHRQLAAGGQRFAPEAFAALGRSLLPVRVWNERLGRAVPVRLVPVPGLFFIGCALLAHLVLTRLPFGRYVYATGGNEETARFCGIDVAAVKTGVYAIAGGLAGLAAVLYAAMYGQGKPDAGQMAELDAIAAVVIGGASLQGGRGRIAGTVVGVLIFGCLSNILVLRGIPSEVQDIAKGGIIIAAVLLQEGHAGRALAGAWRRLRRRPTG